MEMLALSGRQAHSSFSLLRRILLNCCKLQRCRSISRYSSSTEEGKMKDASEDITSLPSTSTSSLQPSSSSHFTVNSFTQNLASALSDPTRSRADSRGFFTRHWGDAFVPLERIVSTPQLPKITLEHFRTYLLGTGKKHRHYLKSKRALRRLLSRHTQQNSVDTDEIPLLFYCASFALNTFSYFEAVFLEPGPGEADRLVSDAERRRVAARAETNNSGSTTQPKPLHRPESSGSLASMQSLQQQVPTAAAQNRLFRPYRSLLDRLEYYHDTVGVLLNYRLESKSEEFWRTVNSYSALHGELNESIAAAKAARQHLASIQHNVYERTKRCIELYYARENRGRMLAKLKDIACLRDARTTVQMLLDQNNFPKALECIETVQEVLSSDLRGIACFRQLTAQLRELHTMKQQETTAFIAKFHERKRQKLASILDAEQWKVVELPLVFQQLIDEFVTQGVLRDVNLSAIRKSGGSGGAPSSLLQRRDSTDGDMDGWRAPSSMSNTSSQSGQQAQSQQFVLLDGEKFVVVATSLILIRVLGQYCGLLTLFPQCVVEVLLNVVETLKNFNSRTCQLILGAGAIQLVGLKTISVKSLALASRSLQLVARFIPAIRREFAELLPAERQQMLRHFDQVLKDYGNHIQEIDNKLLLLMDNHLIGALNEWRVDGKTPTPAFQHVIRQVGKFYSSYSAIMPPEVTTAILLRIHANFKLYLKQHLQARGITPHDAVTYGMASADFCYYVENMRAFPDCHHFPDDTLSDVLIKKPTTAQQQQQLHPQSNGAASPHH